MKKITEITLFNAFCSPIYGCQLWYNFLKEPFCRLHVAFSNNLRLLLKMPTWCSASQLFVQHGTVNFLAVIRKEQFSLLRSFCSCNNAVICTFVSFVSSDRFWRSPMPVAVLRWGQGGTGPPNLAQAPTPKFLDTVVLLLVELIGSIVNFA